MSASSLARVGEVTLMCRLYEGVMNTGGDKDDYGHCLTQNDNNIESTEWARPTYDLREEELVPDNHGRSCQRTLVSTNVLQYLVLVIVMSRRFLIIVEQ